MTEQEEKSTEAKLRRRLKTEGLRLEKTPSRHWTREPYGAGYQIVDDRNLVVAGAQIRPFQMSLTEVSDFVASK